MTEQEAKTKWCPQARYVSRNGEGINRWVDDDDSTLNPLPAHCIASECMMWRPTPETEKFEVVKVNAADQGTTYAQDGWTLESSHRGPHWTRWVTIPAGGFCGLAGKEF